MKILTIILLSCMALNHNCHANAGNKDLPSTGGGGGGGGGDEVLDGAECTSGGAICNPPGCVPTKRGYGIVCNPGSCAGNNYPPVIQNASCTTTPGSADSWCKMIPTPGQTSVSPNCVSACAGILGICKCSSITTPMSGGVTSVPSPNSCTEGTL